MWFWLVLFSCVMKVVVVGLGSVMLVFICVLCCILMRCVFVVSFILWCSRFFSV